MSEKVKKITKLYYSNPQIKRALLDFSRNREVVPRYGEGFGKRPDTLVYESDLIGLVNRGATSFHASEEIWSDPLQLTTDMTPEELGSVRTGWDLLIDIDSPYLDYSKIALKLVIEFLEKHGVYSYGIKFSGNKGFHLVVPFSAFPEIYRGSQTSSMFPDWPRAIVRYILTSIRAQYNKLIGALGVDFKAVERRTNLSKEDLLETRCPTCGSKSIEKQSVLFKCDRCGIPYERPDYQPTKRKLRCTDVVCPGFLQEVEKKKYYYCEKCKTSSFNKFDMHTSQKAINEKSVGSFSDKFEEEFDAEKLGSLDLVLVSPRHLFRMPYSLHEKTALVSTVISKEEVESFSPKSADPLKVLVRNFYPVAKKNEALRLLELSLAYYQEEEQQKEKSTQKQFESIETMNLSGVSEDQFPAPIKKLMKGLVDGRKRGLFVLITFLRCLNFSPEYVASKVHEWNKKNQTPLKEGYIKSQLDWMFRQKRKILPPNYSNASFYKDLGLLDKEPETKNPLGDVLRKLKNFQRE